MISYWEKRALDPAPNCIFDLEWDLAMTGSLWKEGILSASAFGLLGHLRRPTLSLLNLSCHHCPYSWEPGPSSSWCEIHPISIYMPVIFCSSCFCSFSTSSMIIVHYNDLLFQLISFQAFTKHIFVTFDLLCSIIYALFPIG